MEEIFVSVEAVPNRPTTPHNHDGRTWKQALSDAEYFFRERFFSDAIDHLNAAFSLNPNSNEVKFTVNMEIPMMMKAAVFAKDFKLALKIGHILPAMYLTQKLYAQVQDSVNMMRPKLDPRRDLLIQAIWNNHTEPRDNKHVN